MKTNLTMIGNWSLKDWTVAIQALNEEKGWYDDWTCDVTAETAKCAANLHGEVSELWEAARKGNVHVPCDKTESLTCGEEELADIFIRCVDTAIRLGIDIQSAVVKKFEFNKSRPHRHGGKKA